MIIYITTCKVNRKFYIGQDSNNNPDYLGSGLLIRKAIKKYGKENFEKIVLQKCASKEELNECEKFWIKKLNATNREIAYNILPGGEGLGNFHNLPIEQQKKWKRNHKKSMYKKKKRMQKGIYTKNELKDFQRKKLKQFTEKELLQHKNKSERMLTGNYTEKEKNALINNKIRKQKKLYTKAEKLRFKKDSKRKSAGLFTEKEKQFYKRLSVKYTLNGISSPSWMGYVYVYDKDYNLLFKFNNTSEASINLKITPPTLLTLFKTRYFSLKKLYKLNCDYNLLKDCFFIRTKKELSDSTDLRGELACSGVSCEII